MDESPITGSSMEIPNVSHIEVQPQPRRYRTGISEVEKKALREWFRNQPTKPKQSACVLWFERTYAKRIDRGTVSRILSKRFDHLDEGPVSSAVRKDSPKHPLLEKELSEWLQQRQEAGQTVSGDWIIAKAREIWPRINEENEAMPLFSSGWLTRFKKRFASRMADGTQVELPTAPPKNRNEFQGLRTFSGEFTPDDIYSMDETGLLWRKAPFDAIQSESQTSLHKERARLCLIVCTNSTGGDRLPLWVIGHKETPEPLRSLNLRALGARWHYNQNAWISTAIMSDWLLSFYERVDGRRVLLLLDDYHAHQAAVESTPPPANVHIQFFPTQHGGINPPLKMGITQSLKQHYRKNYLSYLAKGFQAGQNPVRTMNLYYTLNWITRIWRRDVANATIFKSFRRSNLIEPQLTALSAPKIHGLQELYNTVIQYNRSAQPATSLEQFLDPVEEEVANETPWFSLDSENAELDEAFTIIPTGEFLPSPQSVITGIEGVIAYMLHHKSGTAEDLRVLESMKDMAQREVMNSML